MYLHHYIWVAVLNDFVRVMHAIHVVMHIIMNIGFLD